MYLGNMSGGVAGVQRNAAAAPRQKGFAVLPSSQVNVTALLWVMWGGLGCCVAEGNKVWWFGFLWVFFVVYSGGVWLM